jgi:tricorn protease-like protein
MSYPPSIIEITLQRKTNKMAKTKIVISTEKWNTQNGEVYKAVVRDGGGKFIGATNQTKSIPVKQKRRSSGFFLMGK